MRAYELAAMAWMAVSVTAFGGQGGRSVVIVDRADTYGDTITQAAGTAQSLFHEAGVDTEWTICYRTKDPWASCTLPAKGSYLTLVVLAEAPRVRPEAMGAAVISKTGEPVVSYAYFDPAARLAKRTGQPVRVVLACIIAHEIGHLMGLQHNSSGIMQADLGQREIFDAAQGRLQFTAEDAGLLREFRRQPPPFVHTAHR